MNLTPVLMKLLTEFLSTPLSENFRPVLARICVDLLGPDLFFFALARVFFVLLQGTIIPNIVENKLYFKNFEGKWCHHRGHFQNNQILYHHPWSFDSPNKLDRNMWDMHLMHTAFDRLCRFGENTEVITSSTTILNNPTTLIIVFLVENFGMDTCFHKDTKDQPKSQEQNIGTDDQTKTARNDHLCKVEQTLKTYPLNKRLLLL